MVRPHQRAPVAGERTILISNVLFRHESVYQEKGRQQTTEKGETEDDGDDGRDGDRDCPIMNVTCAMHALATYCTTI